jgi:surface carbohydrate biosynthesis protein
VSGRPDGGTRAEVVYLYENVARELDVACAVAARLRQAHALEAAIVQWPQRVPTMYGRVAPRVVVLPFCYFEHSFDCLLEWRHAAFFNLSWEQFFYRGNVKAKTPRGTFAVNHVIHHAWSEAYAAFVREQGVAAPHVFLNGQPAYALYDEPYRRYFAPRSELAARHGLDAAKRWVFFPENYNWAFYSPDMIRFFLQAGQSPAEVEEMRDFCTRSFRQVMAWFAQLARTGRVEVVVRPRPSTSLEDFHAAVTAVLGALPPGLHVRQSETVREWILASDIVLSSHSTSLIEAAIAGRRAGMVAPFPVPATLKQEWHDRAPRLATFDALHEACVDSAIAAGPSPLAQWARSTLMSRGDAIVNLADEIARLARGDAPRPPIPSRLVATAQGDWRRVPKWIWFLFRRARARMRRVVPPAGDPTRLREYVAPDEIEHRISRWEAVLEATARRSAERSPRRVS